MEIRQKVKIILMYFGVISLSIITTPERLKISGCRTCSNHFWQIANQTAKECQFIFQYTANQNIQKYQIANQTAQLYFKPCTWLVSIAILFTTCCYFSQLKTPLSSTFVMFTSSIIHQQS
jgi:hypothetical protein